MKINQKCFTYDTMKSKIFIYTDHFDIHKGSSIKLSDAYDIGLLYGMSNIVEHNGYI